MQLKWLIAGILLVGLIACPAQAGLFDWLFGETTSEGTTTVANISDGAWSNGTATIESLDTTTGDVTIHYTMEYVPKYPDKLVQLVANSTGKVIWEGDAYQIDGYWNIYELSLNRSEGYSALLYQNSASGDVL